MQDWTTVNKLVTRSTLAPHRVPLDFLLAPYRVTLGVPPGSPYRGSPDGVPPAVSAVSPVCGAREADGRLRRTPRPLTLALCHLAAVTPPRGRRLLKTLRLLHGRRQILVLDRVLLLLLHHRDHLLLHGWRCARLRLGSDDGGGRHLAGQISRPKTQTYSLELFITN